MNFVKFKHIEPIILSLMWTSEIIMDLLQTFTKDVKFYLFEKYVSTSAFWINMIDCPDIEKQKMFDIVPNFKVI